MSDTALKTRSEKLTLTFMCFMLGSCRRSSLCCGVKRSLASAWMPYLSSVQWVLSSHVFFFSHHKAWSDQSFFTSANRKRKSVSLDPVWPCRDKFHLSELYLTTLHWPLFRREGQIWAEKAELTDEVRMTWMFVWHCKHIRFIIPTVSPVKRTQLLKTPYSSEVQQNRDRTVLSTYQCTVATFKRAESYWNETWTSRLSACLCAGSITYDGPSDTSILWCTHVYYLQYVTSCCTTCKHNRHSKLCLCLRPIILSGFPLK